MLEDLIRERERKLSRYAESLDPYPARSRRRTPVRELLDKFSGKKIPRGAVVLSGRLSGWRDQGKIIFADLRDATGTVQVILNSKETKGFLIAKETFDVGDFVEARGTPAVTKRGEKSIFAKDVLMLSKSVRPIPSDKSGLEDTETRLRKRYLDFVTHADVRDLFVKKSAFWSSIRKSLEAENFLEVETPVLEPVPGGAEAEPFVTHHNALDTDFFLRISLELPLKKLLVGGFEKVFEIGRIFRNEGIDREHLQDYTQMECYWAYADYSEMMKFVERMYKSAIKNTCGTLTTNIGDTKIFWGKKWKVVDYYQAFKEESGLDLTTATISELKNKAREVGAKPEPNAGRGRLIDLVYKKTVRPKLIQPCFLVNPPVDVEPLAKRLDSDKARVARFQIVAAGTELGKGFSELNDPADQRKRFEEQMALRAAGDAEAQRLDEDFLEALEYGMPPAAGFGMSERLFAVLMDKPIREIVTFPLMKRDDEKGNMNNEKTGIEKSQGKFSSTNK